VAFRCVDHNGCVIPFHVERARRALAADSSEKLTKKLSKLAIRLVTLDDDEENLSSKIHTAVAAH